MKKFRVAIIGTGNIGTDLLVKTTRSTVLECVAFVGRRDSSQGMSKARSLGIACSDRSIQYIQEHESQFDLVFDATSAKDHFIHAPILQKLRKRVVDLTPSRIGPMCIPAVNLDDCLGAWNTNMVTCGGQASIPIAYGIAKSHQEIEYVEVVSSIASKSAGPATRLNIDEYITTTENGIKKFSGARSAKAILILNPAIPPIDMQTTIFAKVHQPDVSRLTEELQPIIAKIKGYVPGFNLIVGPILENGRIIVMVRVRGVGDYLPEYAGNLDIINCAAIAMAEGYAKADIQ